MSKYLSTPEKSEQKGRVEDGPINLKSKFTDWPNMGDAGQTGSKMKASGKMSKATAKTSYKTAGAKSAGGGRSGGLGGSKSGGSSGGAKGK